MLYAVNPFFYTSEFQIFTKKHHRTFEFQIVILIATLETFIYDYIIP